MTFSKQWLLDNVVSVRVIDGMSVRQAYKMAALTGLLANPNIDWTFDYMAEAVGKQADALIAEDEEAAAEPAAPKEWKCRKCAAVWTDKEIHQCRCDDCAGTLVLHERPTAIVASYRR